ncbi:hypothetical protein GW17_00042274 [Ensete ventricosum]|uniref:Uncharacterized protein n=1 Tax=Ensete ventricosum TaxID=4639 RepID=A0A426XU38_ENSVE|nr:hypothetical protein B296_00053468 [Ensete ventricosum]RWV95127.1 hypothetical protein GW17_00042274 [Ensete ventricosum]RZR93413.1 hypothetical protein BHM03_00021920 [Ensete ventricosum]
MIWMLFCKYFRMSTCRKSSFHIHFLQAFRQSNSEFTCSWHPPLIYSADGRSFLMSLPQVQREATGTASTMDTDVGDPVQKAEAMAFRRACARLGLGLYLYHEDMV